MLDDFYFGLFASIISFKKLISIDYILFLIDSPNKFSVSWIFWVWLHNFWSRLIWITIWLRWILWLSSKVFWWSQCLLILFKRDHIYQLIFNLWSICLIIFFSWIFWVWLNSFWSSLLWVRIILQWVWWLIITVFHYIYFCSSQSLLIFLKQTNIYQFIFYLQWIASTIYTSVEYVETNFIIFDQY